MMVVRRRWRRRGTGSQAVGLLDGDGWRGDTARQEERGLSERLAGRKTESGDGGVGAGGGRHAVESHCVEGEGRAQGRLRGSWLCLNDGSLYCSTHLQHQALDRATQAGTRAT